MTLTPANEQLTSEEIKQAARILGFDAVGIAPATTPPGYSSFLAWLEAGCAAGMSYLHTQAEPRCHPRSILVDVKSVVMLAVVYGQPKQPGFEADSSIGEIAQYARGQDYHEVLWKKLDSLLAWIQSRSPGIKGRSVVDTAPLMERDYAQLAGLGWIAKNTMLINPRLGSFTFLGALLLDANFEFDLPFQFNRCGTCTRCLDACPTSAFQAPGRLDARRCISYWTIEHKGLIPDEWSSQLHGWAFGCDICQDVCPWNRKAPPGHEPDLQPKPDQSTPDLIEWIEMESADLRKRIRGTALQRAKRTGLVRNAALVLGSRRVERALPGLIRLLDDSDQVIRGSAAWALGNFSNVEAWQALKEHAEDPDETVSDAIRKALKSHEDRQNSGKE